MDRRPSISVIIAVYNRPDFLEKVFAGLNNQTFQDFEVVVADDGSGEEIREEIGRHSRDFAYPIKHVRHEDKGFRKTVIVNRAAQEASAPYLVFIDGDCVPHHRFLERHYKRKRPGQALSGRRVMILPPLSDTVTVEDIKNGGLERRSFWRRHTTPRSKRHGFYFPPAFAVKNIGRTKYEILGSNFSIHKEGFLSVNGYDESIIGRGLEDNNLCARLILANITIRTIANEALQYHLHHKSDPIPHGPETIDRYLKPSSAWTPNGIRKG